MTRDVVEVVGCKQVTEVVSHRLEQGQQFLRAPGQRPFGLHERPRVARRLGLRRRPANVGRERRFAPLLSDVVRGRNRFSFDSFLRFSMSSSSTWRQRPDRSEFPQHSLAASTAMTSLWANRLTWKSLVLFVAAKLTVIRSPRRLEATALMDRVTWALICFFLSVMTSYSANQLTRSCWLSPSWVLYSMRDVWRQWWKWNEFLGRWLAVSV